MNYIYISSCCENGGIYCFAIENGGLKQVDFMPVDRPMYTIKHKDRLYAVLRAPFNDNSESGIISYKINRNGMLFHKSSIVSTMGEVGCHLCVSEDNIYAVNYISGSVIKLPDKLVVHKGSSINKARQESAHTHFVTQTPDGMYIAVTDLGMDKIFIYDKDLNKVNDIDTPKGAGPRHLAFSSDGRFCYCVNELDSSVCVYAYNDGMLILKNTYSTIPKDFNGFNTAAAIRCVNDYLYVSNRGHNSIACFEVRGDSLELQNICDCGGDSPRDFDIKDDILICTNENDGSVAVFEIKDKTNFELKQKINVKNALCVTII